MIPMATVSRVRKHHVFIFVIANRVPASQRSGKFLCPHAQAAPINHGECFLHFDRFGPGAFVYLGLNHIQARKPNLGCAL